MKKESIIPQIFLEAICDLCPEKGVTVCAGCKRDLCRKHRNYPGSHPFSLEYQGDYGDNYCGDCFRTLLSFEEVIKKAHAKLARTLQMFEASWRKKIKPWTVHTA